MNVNDLMKRYKVSSQAIRKFVRLHLDEINENGIEHARQTDNGWIFDAEAVERIDKLRGIDKVAIIEEIESEKVKELEAEIKNLQKALMIAQSEIIKSQKETLALKDRLLESERKSLEAVSSSSILNAELEESKRRESAANEQIRELKNRSLLERILNR